MRHTDYKPNELLEKAQRDPNDPIICALAAERLVGVANVRNGKKALVFDGGRILVVDNAILLSEFASAVLIREVIGQLRVQEETIATARRALMAREAHSRPSARTESEVSEIMTAVRRPVGRVISEESAW